MNTPFRLVFFAGLIVLGLALGDVAFFRGAGCYFVLSGIIMAWKKKVPIGARGAPPSSYLVGGYAILFGALVVCFGVAVVLYAREIGCCCPRLNVREFAERLQVSLPAPSWEGPG